MPKLIFNRALLVFALLLAPAAGAAAQQDPYAPAPPATATPTPKPLVVPQLMTVNPPAAGAYDSVLPTPTPTPVVYRQGVLVAALDGRVVMEQGADQTFNPASTIKLATALQALRTYGPDYRFTTAVWTTGTFDRATGTVTGDLIVSGRDPSLHDEHAVALAREMNKLGVRTVTGDLVVSPGFTLDFQPSALRSGERFYDTLDSTRRPAAATNSWYEECQAKNDQACFTSVPSVAVMGAVYVAPVPAGATVLLTQRSSTLADVLKVLLCYSNNFMAERLGEMMGGATGLQGFLVREVGLPAADVRLASTSGLGVNRLSPRSMMKVYVALRGELARHRLEPSDILPVAGVDPGTLKKRYTEPASRGSVVAKTGTLGRTDGGVSALVGEMRAQDGETLLFVIFNRHGSPYRFRQEQDALVTSIQSARGGPAPFQYTPHTLAMRLADTEFNARNKNEYEGTSNDQ
ncbi:MAG TPA: D-alanyl-D-alanine carboxypeptidase [Pyrinomonadaceae bacterium]|jgi:D-alanyl-D-alanine carboxypeptidase/D-alanyl-D-alanine-endopeptidase (penicillin-binding protein 4)|nr:D-alanyl-D-alanine carboxypeptidase [Pyrinomonadaceae bacterium]